MGLPMCLLYESCIWIAWFMQRKADAERRDLSRMDHSLAAYEYFFASFRLRPRRGRRFVSERLHLSVAARSFGQRTAPLLLSVCKKQIPWHQNIPLLSWLCLARALRELRRADSRFAISRSNC